MSRPERTRGARPALTLFLLAPFVGEFLLGNLTLRDLPLGVALAPLYGFGALLVREIGRRRGGWPAMAVLAVAYALIEEGPVDQLLWNSHYVGVDYVHGPGHVASLGLNVTVVQTVIALHAVWSICVPIVLAESLYPDRARQPWLDTRGLVMVGVLYAAAAGLVFWGNWSAERFLGSSAQNGGMALVILVLIAAALLVDLRPRLDARPAPHSLVVGATGLVATSAYWGPVTLLPAERYAWWGFAVWWLVLLGGVASVLRWSRRAGWGQVHHFALATGATLTYLWVSFPLSPEGVTSPGEELASNLIFGAVALGVLAVGLSRQRRATRIGSTSLDGLDR